MKLLFALISGFLFGIGLSVSGMTDPHKVKGFLDITGNWDPSLALVMGGALLVGSILFPYITQKKKPLFESGFSLPTKNDIDKYIIIGPALFGIGWGLIGLCPGPAFANLLVAGKPIVVFTLVMLISKVVTDKLKT
mgnify:CR=1 FL=1